MATSLNDLAHAQRRHREVEPFYWRSLSNLEKVVGPAHRDVAKGLENHAALLRESWRHAKASMMEARAEAICAKPTNEIPAAWKPSRRPRLTASLVSKAFIDRSD